MTINREDLKIVMTEIFDERSRIDSNLHQAHHVWIEESIAAEKARKEMLWDVSKAVAQWSVLGLIGGLIYWLRYGSWPH